MPISDWSENNTQFKWIDVQNPTVEELKQISKKYKLHRYTVMDCLQSDHLPKQENLGSMQFVITRFLVDNQSLKAHTIQEVSSKLAIFYNAELIITVHRLKQPFLKAIRIQHAENGGYRSVSELVTKIVWQVLHSYDQPALDVSQQIDDIEEHVFMKPLTKVLLEDIYLIRRKASVCLKLLLLSKEVINKIPSIDIETSVLQDAKDLHLKLVTLFEQAHEDSTHLLDIYLSLSSKNSNEVMKVLTIFSVFLLPPTFIVGLYGMNFEYMPELHHRYAYPIVLGVIISITAIIYFWFKRKGWL
ncbi:MAG TPA: CorA family divalent cation transporter [Sphingobacteriaceae bacterium]|nr:CorA family divalent cation transporter [Sphingobacteriaceae bacterium]